MTLPGPMGEAGAGTRRQVSAHVLVVEDNAANQVLALRMLERLGHTVELAANGRDALDAMARTLYDVVLMDCQMPVMDGYEATIEIRRTEGRGRRTPIIAMTAGAMVDDEQKCLAIGMDAFVAKPVEWAELATMLDGCVRAARARAVTDATSTGGTEGRPTAVLDAAALDASVIAGIWALDDGSGGVVDQLFAAFLSDATNRAAMLRAAMLAHDGARIGQVGHSLRGSSANFGALGLAAQCAEVERLAAAGELSLLAGALDLLDAELEHVRHAVAHGALRSRPPCALASPLRGEKQGVD